MAQEASSSSSSSSKTISLKTADGNLFEVEPAIAKQMLTVQTFVEADDESGPNSGAVTIPLPNIQSRELVKIIEYCKHHREADDAAKAEEKDADSDKAKGKEAAGDAVKDFDAEFVKAVSTEELMCLILASNYLNMKGLLDFLSQSAADRIQNKSVEYVRKFFGIENDYTAEEEAALRKEYEWAFEGVDQD